jgi:dihydrodipicolinate synthase/N-acetylneuraminate lyase
VTVISCHDEYLLASILEGADGALVGFAGYAPDLIVELVDAALKGDLPRAREAQAQVEKLSRIIYQFGEPSGNAHQRMKTADTQDTFHRGCPPDPCRRERSKLIRLIAGVKSLWQRNHSLGGRAVVPFDNPHRVALGGKP